MSDFNQWLNRNLGKVLISAKDAAMTMQLYHAVMVADGAISVESGDIYTAGANYINNKMSIVR